jgi:hypothetical protein
VDGEDEEKLKPKPKRKKRILTKKEELEIKKHNTIKKIERTKILMKTLLPRFKHQ